MARQALELFENTHDLALAILDVMMPEMDGYEVCRRIRANSDLPVLILTARDTESDEVAGFRCGADEYISKPFSPAILVTRVKTCCGVHSREITAIWKRMVSVCCTGNVPCWQTESGSL